jgi:hypothetical protein
MMTLKDIAENRSGNLQSLDGDHWEPVLHAPRALRTRLRDALSVFRREAVAVRNTRYSDLDTKEPSE